MPAAAVIPAPIAYIKVVAVKKLVVGFRAGTTSRWNIGLGAFGYSDGVLTCLLVWASSVDLEGIKLWLFWFYSFIEWGQRTQVLSGFPRL